MNTALVTTQGNLALDRNPAAVYLAGLAASSRVTMRGALDGIAAMVSGGQADALSLDWKAASLLHVPYRGRSEGKVAA